MDKLIKKLAAYAKTIGVPSFFFGVRQGNMTTFHMENLPLSDAMQLMISGFHYVISLEVERHPEWSKEYRDIYAGLAKNFDKLIRSSNEEFMAYNAKHSKQNKK